MNRSILAVACAAILAGSTALPAAAQKPHSTRPAFVAIPDAFPDLGVGAHAIVLRAPDRDVILLDGTEASPELLAAAAFVLTRLRRESLVPTQPSLHPVAGYVLPEEGRARALGRMKGMLAQLEHRRTTEVGNLGTGRWIAYAMK